ncbi:CPBP family intramembrane glutamic endopeptidase [Salinibacterium sp. ZJ450]|uniref:CPBP family intramembrane glutamic endopeptidase n=1 Tax=Salinibacterium sp. ZJ450 TaxID=2708338 RepID=UPI001421230A|nr:CPBP family intramembrane glutamic endopeptidase [Salinibacterium sp. ZJ450]
MSRQRARWGLPDAAAGLLLAAALLLLMPTLPLVEPWATPLSYAAVWLPLLGAVLLAVHARGSGSLALDLGLRITALDVLIGLVVGLGLRTAAFVIDWIAYGKVTTGAPTLGPVVYDGWWLFAVLIAPILIAPVVEELFFRGLLQRSLNRLATPVAVTVSAVCFALLHSVTGYSIPAALTTFLVGLALGALAAGTNRLGAAIVAHATFNAAGVFLTLA